MSKKISKEELIKLANSVHFILTPSELDDIHHKSLNVIQNLEVLKDIDTTNVRPTDYCVAKSQNTLRSDLISVNNNKETYLKNAKNRKGNFIVVK
ncbi:MAG: hypothetical protein LBT77_02045 [Mycoplasmataceae bacterium]|jgi:aspartyl/glutamyl-tRNA(Asn/Gln) amidotransferase C subunit|nr:hypothetical protein [Mycoplasmataceae bacterium]